MRPLTIEEVNRIGEAVSRELPATSVVEWEYKIGRKSHLLIFRIRNRRVVKKRAENLENDLKRIQILARFHQDQL